MFRIAAGETWIDGLPLIDEVGDLHWKSAIFVCSYLVINVWVVLQVQRPQFAARAPILSPPEGARPQRVAVCRVKGCSLSPPAVRWVRSMLPTVARKICAWVRRNLIVITFFEPFSPVMPTCFFGHPLDVNRIGAHADAWLGKLSSVSFVHLFFFSLCRIFFMRLPLLCAFFFLSLSL